jgi:hypothetical protein
MLKFTKSLLGSTLNKFAELFRVQRTRTFTYALIYVRVRWTRRAFFG